MSLIGQLKDILSEAKSEYEKAEPGAFKPVIASGDEGRGTLVKGDNLKFMKHLAENGFNGKINLIYIDPPFFSKANYDTLIKIESDKVKDIPPIKSYAYRDIWADGMEDYLRMMCVRLYMMRDLLSGDGSLWVHLDWHVAHYVKVLLDEIFGEKNFINEVIWTYKSGGTSKRHFSRKHDTLLFYAKTKNYYFEPQTEKSYNRGFKPYRFKGVKEYRDELGWYTMVNMKDVWQIDMVGRTSGERTGYVTQKPEALIARIVESCSREGDICADFFGGSGTLASVCHRAGRRWISCDIGNQAFAEAGKRLIKAGADFTAMEQADGIKDKEKVTARAGFSVEPLALSDKSVARVALDSYNIDIKNAGLDGASEKTVKNLLKIDPLCLIDYWSVDFNFDGKVHKPGLIFFAGKDKIFKCEKIGTSFDRISVHIADVFGNNTFISEKIGK